jgi:small subunit ribosomal protein S24e
MDIEIVEDKENPLLGRREVRFTVTFDGGMVKRDDVREKLIALLNAKPELTVVDYLKVEYGKAQAKGYAKIYSDEDLMRKVERKHILERNFGKKDEGKENA